MLKRTWILLFFSLVFLAGVLQGQNPKPSSEADIIKLLELQIGDDAIISKVKKDGINFAMDDQSMQRLEKAGASTSVITALKTAGQAKPGGPGASGGPTVTYDNVLQLLKLSIDEDAILKKLTSSPTLFTLDAQQLAELKQAGASQKLLDAMQSKKVDAIVKGGDITALAIILDCSGSMRERTSDGETKMSAAKRVVGQLIEKLPDGIDLTFIIYGHDVALECGAVKVVRPLTPLDNIGKNQIRAVLADLEPTGHTPIALALRLAGDQLAKTKGLSEVVLVTDGMETCHGKPDDEAAALLKKVNLKSVEVIGLVISKQEQAGVESIAKAGQGHFYGVQNAKDLADAIKKTIPVVAELPPIPSSETRVRSLVSSVVVKPITHRGFPVIWRVSLYKAGEYAQKNNNGPVQRSEKLGEGMVVSAGEYDVVYEVFGNLKGHCLLKNLQVGEKETVTVETDRLVSAIVVHDLNIPNLTLSYVRVYKQSGASDPDQRQ